MIHNVYGIRHPAIPPIEPVIKPNLNSQKEQEKQNEEKRKKLYEQKAFIEIYYQKVLEEKTKKLRKIPTPYHNPENKNK